MACCTNYTLSLPVTAVLTNAGHQAMLTVTLQRHADFRGNRTPGTGNTTSTQGMTYMS